MHPPFPAPFVLMMMQTSILIVISAVHRQVDALELEFTESNSEKKIESINALGEEAHIEGSYTFY